MLLRTLGSDGAALAIVLAALLLPGCGENGQSGSTASAPGGASSQIAPTVPVVPVDLLSQGLELAEVSRSDIGRAKLNSRLGGYVVMPESAIQWHVNIISRSEKPITSLRVAVAYHTERRTIEAIPFGSTLQPSGLLDVLLVLPMPMGMMPPSLNIEGTVEGVRFADGTTLGSMPPSAAAPAPGTSSPAAGAPSSGSAPSLAAPAWEPFGGTLVAGDTVVSLVEATYGTPDTQVDVSEQVQRWLDIPDWPAPLVVAPHVLDVEDPAPGQNMTLHVVLHVGETRVVLEASDGEPIRLGGPGSTEVGVFAARKPIELDGVRILAAWYGAGDAWINALPGLRPSVRGGALQTVVVPVLFGSDPAPGVQKELRIYAQVEGKPGVQQATFEEGAVIKLP